MLDMLKACDHLCLLYESPGEWREAVVPFISIGLKKGEKCIYIADPSTADETRKYLKDQGVDVSSAEKSGQLVVVPEAETYTGDGIFDPDKMIALLISEAEKAIAEGYPALRVSGEMTWVLRGHPSLERLLEYETKLDRDFFPKYPCLTLCQYHRGKFDQDILKGVIMTHPLLIKGNRIYENFYYVPAEEFLKRKRRKWEVQCLLDSFERVQQLSEALCQSEERYRTLVGQSLMGLVVVDIDFRIVFANDAFAQISGYSVGELLALSPKDVQALVYPEDQSLVWGRFRSRLEGKAVPSRYEYRGIKKDGSVRWLEMHADRIEYGGKPAVQGVIIDITERKRIEDERRQSLDKLLMTMEAAIEAMAAVIEIRDPHTAGHQRRVAQLSAAIAEELGLSEDRIRGLHMACIVHDIGKVQVPAEILNKPARLTEPEFDLIKTHPSAGYEILKHLDFPWPVAQIVLQHHERMNGSGYPLGISDGDILLEARILGVADVVEAMVSHRPYRPPLGIDQALEEISRNSGILYDSRVVDACLKLFHAKGFRFN